MSSTTSGNSFHGINKSGDNFLDDIEKFLNEYEIPNKTPPKSGRVFTDSDLLNVLDSDNSDKLMSSQKPKPPPPTKPKPPPPTCPVLPKKRKIPEPSGAAHVKKKVPLWDNKPKKRGRPKKLQKAVVKKCPEPKFFQCHKLPLPKKRKIDRIAFHVKNRHKAKQILVTCRCDSQTVRNVVIKKEIIDLTYEDVSYPAIIRFGNIHFLETEAVEALDVTVANAEAIQASNYLNKVSIYVPEIHFDLDKTACIDLTDDSNTYVAVASEKECANKIVPILYKYHKIYEVNKKMEDVLSEISDCLLKQEPREDMFPFRFFSENTILLGDELVAELSRMWVKNLNLSRFVEIMASKLDASFGISLKPQKVFFYLRELLNRHRGACKNRLLTTILRGVDEYAESRIVKDELNEEVVFTEEQLKELRSQIEQYIVIAIRQEELILAAFREAEDIGFSTITKEIKSEMLHMQDFDFTSFVKVENGVIHILEED